jgi:hypothetical protein
MRTSLVAPGRVPLFPRFPPSVTNVILDAGWNSGVIKPCSSRRHLLLLTNMILTCCKNARVYGVDSVHKNELPSSHQEYTHFKNGLFVTLPWDTCWNFWIRLSFQAL